MSNPTKAQIPQIMKRRRTPIGGLIASLLFISGRASASLSQSSLLHTQPAPQNDIPFSIPAESSSLAAAGFLNELTLFMRGDAAPFGNLGKRDSNNDNCPTGYTNCHSIGDSKVCCASNQLCARDQNGNVGCCPVGAVCTGAVPSTIGISKSGSSTVSSGFTQSASSSSLLSSTSETTVHTSETTQTTPTTASTPTSSEDGYTSVSVLIPGVTVTATGSIVSNSYFPFPYIPTTYTDATQCSSAWSACQTNSGLCLARLTGNSLGPVATDGGSGGLTIQAPNGGVTVAAGNTYGVTGLPLPSASSVCSSLSLQACYGLQVQACQAYGAGQTGFILGTGSASKPSKISWTFPFGIGVALFGGSLLIFM